MAESAKTSKIPAQVGNGIMSVGMAILHILSY